MSTDDKLKEDVYSIPDFYEGSSVFITGATGFIGKSVVEKLLRSCWKIDKIFILVRAKKGSVPNERVQQLLTSKLFDKVRSERGESFAKEKIVPVSGDMSEDNLGISEEDERMLVSSNISVIIHSAATIKFDEPLKAALQVNTLGTLKVIRLGRKLASLKTLVHVSTAYSNCDMSHIGETIYKSKMSPNLIVESLKWMPEEAFDQISKTLIATKPNTYTFTKHLAESLFLEESRTLPFSFVIIRPTIVGATLKEPIPGWIDNYSGASGLFVACGMGLLRSMMAYPDAVANIVPVDIVANIVIASPWFQSINKSDVKGQHVQAGSDDSKASESLGSNLVINCESGHIQNPLVWDLVPKYIERFYVQNPFEKALRYPSFRVTNNGLKNRFYVAFTHNAVAFGLDIMLRCTGQKPRVGLMYSKLHRALQSLEYFTQHYWEWEVNNLKRVEAKMKEVQLRAVEGIGSDANKHDSDWTKDWNVSIEGLNWAKYIEFYCLGTKKYVMKEDMAMMGKARHRMKKLKLIHYGLVILSTLVTGKLTHLVIKLIMKLWQILKKQSSYILRHPYQKQKLLNV